VCPPRASSRSKSYRAASWDWPFWLFFAALGISPRGISGKPGSGDAPHPLIQTNRAKEIAVIQRFIDVRSSWDSQMAKELLIN
jgi:hypothetical protein